MKEFKHFLGIDVSKDFFDVVIILNSDKKNKIHNQFVNNNDGLKSLVVWLKSNLATSKNTLVCLEHTGMYGNIIIQHLLGSKFKIWVEMSLKIIRSLGIQRGKNDKVDAQRIALYAMKNVEEAQLYEPSRKVVEKIRTLLGIRDHLVTTRALLIKNSNELKGFEPELARVYQKHTRDTLSGINKDLKSIEKELDQIVKSDEQLNNLFEKTTSVVGIGKITALYLICFTNEFKHYQTPRQLACYCGVVPFEHTSGKSIRTRPKVHYMANKTLKKHLHLCAMSCISSDQQIKEYYQRKVAEGKNKMLVLNNVRNKLIHRICAYIRDNKIYEKRIA